MNTLLLLIFAPLISALAFQGPVATPFPNDFDVDLHGRNPLPTQGPDIRAFLKRRSGSLTLIEGPDSICGYQYGSSNGALGLCDTSTCGFATQGTDTGIVCFGSFTTEARPLWTSCIGGTRATSCLADSACSDNPGIIACTGAHSYCNVGTWMGLGVEAVWCGSTAHNGSMIPISTTFVGQLGRQLSTVLGSITSLTTSPLSSSSSISTPSLSSLSTTTTISSSSTSSSVPTGPTTSSAVPTPAPIGPIVGGVVGRLALIAAVVVGFIICLRRKRNDEFLNHTSKDVQDFPGVPSGEMNGSQSRYADKYPVQTSTVYVAPRDPPTPSNTEQQVQYQQQFPNQTPYSPEKYPVAATSALAASQMAESSKQEYQPAISQSMQQYPQASPFYDPYHQQQQHQLSPPPQSTNTYYSAPPGAPTFQIQSPSSPNNLEPHERSMSPVSSPGSPAPAYAHITPAAAPNSAELPSEGEAKEMSGMGRMDQMSGRVEMEGRGMTKHSFTAY